MMGKCPNCGDFSWAKSPDKLDCIVCGKQVCDKCGRHLFDIRWRGPSEVMEDRSRLASHCYVCSEGCYNEFLREVKENVDKAEVVRISEEEVYWKKLFHYDNKWHGMGLKLSYVWVPENIVELAYISWFQKHRTNELVAPLLEDKAYVDMASKSAFYKEVYGLFLLKFAAATGIDPSILQREQREREQEREQEELLWKQKREQQEQQREEELLSSISHCERVGRYDDAASACEELAQIYERRSLYDKARELRDRARRLLGKGPQVVVDLNKLIQQVKESGITVAYRCPHCGGILSIGKNTSADLVRICKHCGSEIETMDLADFLRAALS